MINDNNCFFYKFFSSKGMGGLGYVICSLVIGVAIALSTIISLSALITNGAPREKAPGGVYYYITKTMGLIVFIYFIVILINTIGLSILN